MGVDGVTFFDEIKPSTQRGFATLAEQAEGLRQAILTPNPRTPLGLPPLDRHIPGIAPQEVMLLAARAGTGKSAVGTHVLSTGVPAIFFSLEMTADRVLHRLYCQTFNHSAADLEAARAEGVPPKDLDELAQRLPHTVVVDAQRLSWVDMASSISAYEHHFGLRPKLVIVDYLELIGGMKSKGEISHERVSAVANEGKEFAVEQNVAVILLHQLNASVGEWEPPSARAAKFGGVPEADFAVGLYRPGMNPTLAPSVAVLRRREIRFRVIKDRIFGSEGTDIEMVLTESMKIVEPTRVR